MGPMTRSGKASAAPRKRMRADAKDGAEEPFERRPSDTHGRTGHAIVYDAQPGSGPALHPQITAPLLEVDPMALHGNRLRLADFLDPEFSFTLHLFEQ